MSYAVISYNSNFTVDINDGYYVYALDASSNNITVSLPDISLYDGIPYLFVRTDTNNSNTVTLSAYSGQNIMGSSTKLLSVGDAPELISFSSNWLIRN